MSDKQKSLIVIFLIVVFPLSACLGLQAWAVEPSMATYSSVPVFMTSSAPPLIMIILDNSLSMNDPAYSDAWPYDANRGGGAVGADVSAQVAESRDDAEEYLDWHWVNTTNDALYMGEHAVPGPDHYTACGMHFPNIQVEQGATITRAYITFKANGNNNSNINLEILGEASDDAVRYSAYHYNVTGRNYYNALAVPWNPVGWSNNSDYDSPELKTIVQEIVNRPGWGAGHGMAFMVRRTNLDGVRKAYSYDAGGSRGPTLHIEVEPEPAAPGAEPAAGPKFYGYFDPDSQYRYDSNDFVRDPAGPWNGNWLNWLCMRRVDIARKVMTGGKAVSRTGGGNDSLKGEETSTTFTKNFNGSGWSPYSGNYWFGMKDGYIYVDTDWDPYHDEIDKFNIRVVKDEVEEPEVFYNGEIAGVLQRVGEKARWGNMWFSGNVGGVVANRIGHPTTTFLTDLANTPADAWTPLAETFYVCMRHFMQQSCESGLGYGTDAQNVKPQNDTWDPYMQDGQVISCSDAFVILLTDGAPTGDEGIPAGLRDYDGDSRDPGIWGLQGTDYLDDVALYAHTVDLRPDHIVNYDGTVQAALNDKALDGDQNITLYTIFAFNTDDDARRLLKDAARNGGFVDKNGNNRPDGDYDDPPEQRLEWDANGDGDPDTYFEAQDGYILEERLMAAITDILLRASSGTAVSVLATSSEGEGTLVQAYFKPQLTTGTQEIKWLGYLQSLWVDSLGRTREDTPPQGTNPGLVLAHDKIVEFFFDSASGESSFRRYDVDENGNKAFNDTNSNGIQDAGEDYIYTTQTMDNLQPVWEAGSRLHQRDASTRTILTYMDKDNDGSLDVDDPATVGVDEGESVNFNVSNYSSIQPWLGVKDGAAWAYLGDTYDNRAKNLIRFIRGDEDGYEGTPTLRYRLLSGYNWKLGDIVHSTPVTIGRPMDNYNVIYGDQTYQNYYDRYKNREQVVYVGGNDGMMHAFYMGKYVAGDNSATTPADPTDSASVAEAMEEVYFEKAAGTTETWGDELWAYIPQAILPHLKWLADTSYTHVYSVDLKPKLVDAKIFVGNDDDPTTGKHPNGWGTVLIGGLNMGGKAIDVTDQFPDFPSGAGTDSTRTFTSCYFAIDVTDPHDPVLLWERTYTNVGLTTSLPTVAKVGDSWFAIFGSGPTDYQGDSSQKASIYVVDLATGALRRRHECAEDLAFMSSPITVDVSLNYNVDVGYIGETFKSGSTNLGMMYVIRVPKTSDEDGNWQTATSGDAYNADPTSWSIYRMLNVGGPITAPAGASFDSLNNLWVYFGTGRYYSTADKSDTSQQYFLGVKDPYYNSAMYSSESDATTKSYIWASWDFLDSTDINVNTDLSVTNYGGGTTWGTLVDGARAKDGWWMGLKEADGSWVGERVLNKPTVLGGIVFDTTFTPNSDICGFGGSSNLLGLYYETGTAYYKPVFAGDSGTTTVSSGGTTKTQVEKKASVGIGRGSSVAIHVGKQDGVTGYVQQSTGIVEALELSPAFKVRSGFIYWRER